MLTTQAQVRAAFWRAQPSEVSHFWKGKRQNSCPADVRAAFVNYVYWLARDGQISESLAARVTL